MSTRNEVLAFFGLCSATTHKGDPCPNRRIDDLPVCHGHVQAWVEASPANLLEFATKRAHRFDHFYPAEFGRPCVLLRFHRSNGPATRRTIGRDKLVRVYVDFEAADVLADMWEVQGSEVAASSLRAAVKRARAWHWPSSRVRITPA